MPNLKAGEETMNYEQRILAIALALNPSAHEAQLNKATQAIIQLITEAHRKGQEDCREAGAVTNHKAFPEAVERYVRELVGEGEAVPPPLGVPSYPGAVEANMYAQEWVRGRNVLRAELIAKLNKEKP